MDLTWTAEQEAFRAEARSWLEANVPREPLPSGDTREGFAASVEWERHLYANGWSVVSWPRKYGGRDASLWQWLIFEEEYYRAGAPPRVTQNGIFLLAPSLFTFGTQEQQDTLLPRMAAAEDLWAQGWSEPGAGSDLAALQSRAVRAPGGSGWLLSGQKTWTTRGAFCTHMFGLFRTDPDQSRHRGLTYFLVPLDAPGVTVRGFPRFDGDEGFADVFLDEVRVDDDMVLGELGQGWKVAMATTGSERGLTLRSPGRYTASFERLRRLARSRGVSSRSAGAPPGDAPFAGPEDEMPGAERDRLVRLWMDVRAYELYTLRTVTGIVGGSDVGAESSLNKVHWSELDIRLHELAADLLGTESAVDDTWARGREFALAGPIYAGTNEIQRNIIAERLLGLPRR